MRHVIMLAAAMVLMSVWRDPLSAGDELKAINLEKVNTDADEDDPYVTPNGLQVYFASKRGGNWEIYRSARNQLNVPFPAAKPFVSSKEYDARSPFVYQSKEAHLYFAKNEVPDEKLKDLKNFDIWRKTGERAPLPLLHISEKQDEMWPWLTPSGKEFYFSRNLAVGWTLFVTQGDIPGPGLAKKVGFEPEYCHATVDSKGLTMYLQGPLEGRRTGIYRSKRMKTGAPWSMPEEVTALNHPEGKRGTMSPCLSGDRLYFASDRPGGKGGLDIWYVPVSQIK